MFNILSHQRNVNQNKSEILSPVRIAKIKKKTQVIAHAGKDVKQEEYSSIAGGSGNLYNHFGNQFGVFSVNSE